LEEGVDPAAASKTFRGSLPGPMGAYCEAMSEENVEIVRQPVAVAPHPRRRIEERAGLRFPGVLALLARLVLRLPPRSRLRQEAIRRAVQVGLEANNRRDFEAAYALYDPQVELVTASGLAGLGFDRVYSGREERIRFQKRWTAEWGDFQFAPEELVDLGDGRVLVSGHIVGSGLSSGAAFNTYWGYITTTSDGRVIREHFFFDRREALEAAGLSE
jgi:ketosteroid isomerase-like protein